MGTQVSFCKTRNIKRKSYSVSEFKDHGSEGKWSKNVLVNLSNVFDMCVYSQRRDFDVNVNNLLIT